VHADLNLPLHVAGNFNTKTRSHKGRQVVSLNIFLASAL
jgi:hypothetical protein